LRFPKGSIERPAMRAGEDLPGYMRVPDLVTGGSNPVGCDPALAPASPR
jgi:hypothetical protein